MMKSVLKRVSWLESVNAWLKRQKFRQDERWVQYHYSAVGDQSVPDVTHTLQGKSLPFDHVFLVGTMEAQDRSGMFQAAEGLGRKFSAFTKADGSYGLAFPKTKFEIDVRIENTARLAQLIADARPQPDLIIGQMMGLNMDPALLQQFRDQGITVINIVMDDRLPDLWRPLPNGLRRGGIELARAVDVTFTTCADRIPFYHKEGAAAAAISLGSDGKIFKTDKSRDIAISFVGNRYGYRNQIVKAVQDAGLPIEVYGKGWPNGPVDVHRASEINVRSRIILGSGLVGHMRDVYTLKLRDYDAMISGACYVTHRNPDLLRMFEEGRHLYCYETLDELVAVLKHCLSSPEETAQIGANAQAFVIENYTWDKVLRESLKTLGMLQ